MKNNYIENYINGISYHGTGGEISPLVAIARIQFAIGDTKEYEKTLKKIYKIFSPVKENPKKHKRKGYFKELDGVTYYETGLICDGISGSELCVDGWLSEKRLEVKDSAKKQQNKNKGLTSLRWDSCVLRLFNNPHFNDKTEIIFQHLFDKQEIHVEEPNKNYSYKENQVIIDLAPVLLSCFNDVEKKIQKYLNGDPWENHGISLRKTEIVDFLRFVEARELIPEDKRYILDYEGRYPCNSKNENDNFKNLTSSIIFSFNARLRDSVNFQEEIIFQYMSFEDCQALYDIFKNYRGKRYDSEAIEVIYSEIREKQIEALKTMTLKNISFKAPNNRVFQIPRSSYDSQVNESINEALPRLKEISKCLCEVTKDEPDLHKLLSILKYIDDTLVFSEEKIETENTEPKVE